MVTFRKASRCGGFFVIKILKKFIIKYANYIFTGLTKSKPMRKIVLILTVLTMFACKSKKTSTAGTVADKTVAKKEYVQYRDDFRSVSKEEREAFLKDIQATYKNYSVLIFTRGYKGEGIQVSNDKKVFFSSNVISNLKTGIAHSIRIDNTLDTKVFDSFTKKSVIIESEETKKYKFIYLMKDNNNKEMPFSITYSNTLRPLK